MSKKNEVVETKSNELATVNMNEWGDVVVEAKDLILPKILLQQAMSAAVKSRAANDGDYLNTLTDKVCSNDKGDVNVLPFFCRQSYTTEKWNGKKFEFFKSEPYTGEQKPFEEEIGGTRFRNMHIYEFFCLLEEGGLPAIVPFKSTSHRTGKKLFNIMYMQNPQQGKTPANNWITLGRSEDSKDGDKYFVMEMSLARQSTPEELKECLTWIKTIKTTEFKTAEEKPVTQTTPTEVRF
jgi:hypothetical protein